MITDAEAGLIDLVVVHKLDRFSRNLLTTLETLQRLDTANVGFVSISESMDFSTPIGKVILATLGAFAEYYSANLSTETRKGKTERKRQGLYNGVLPFGTVKGPDGVPVAHPDTHPGLLLAFGLAAAGKTDREVAQALNAAGYRTSGNRGANPFTKDGVRPILRNRFYLGELPDGQDGWLPGKHQPLLDPVLFDQVRLARLRHEQRPRRVPGIRSPWSLSGLATCAWCGSPFTAAGRVADGRQRAQCQGRIQGRGCTARSMRTTAIDQQLGAVLNQFALGSGTQNQLLVAWQRHRSARTDTLVEKARIERGLERARTLYLDGDLDDAEYRLRKRDLTTQLASLPNDELEEAQVGERLAAFLTNLAGAWEVATPAERNRIARELFDGVLIEEGVATAVRPRPELKAFFVAMEPITSQENDDAAPVGTGTASGDSVNVSTQRRKRRGSNPRSQP